MIINNQQVPIGFHLSSNEIIKRIVSLVILTGQIHQKSIYKLDFYNNHLTSQIAQNDPSVILR